LITTHGLCCYLDLSFLAQTHQMNIEFGGGTVTTYGAWGEQTGLEKKVRFWEPLFHG
jgi:hypothetical protein